VNKSAGQQTTVCEKQADVSKPNTDSIQITQISPEEATGLSTQFKLWHNAVHGNINGSINDDITKMLDSYYAGNATLDDMEKAIIETYDRLKQLNNEIGEKTGVYLNDEYIIYNLVCDFYRNDAWSAVNANFREGGEIADQYGSENDRDWIYYNAKYYYMSEDMDNVIGNFCKNALKDVERTNPSLDFNIKDKHYFSFNDIWNHYADARHMGGLIDRKSEPPAGFTLFYKRSQFSETDRKNSTLYAINAVNPNAKGDEDGSMTYYIEVPQGQALLRVGSFLDHLPLTGKRTGGDFDAPVVDITSYLLSKYTQGKDFIPRFNDFVRENFGTFNDGVLIIGNGEFEKTVNIPYMLYGAYDYTLIKPQSYGLLEKSDSENYMEFNKFMQNFKI
jgi:hypothetical protein